MGGEIYFGLPDNPFQVETPWCVTGFDSWVNYPFPFDEKLNLLGNLAHRWMRKTPAHNWMVLGENGAELLRPPRRARQDLEWLAHYAGDQVSAVIISGGGNDFVERANDILTKVDGIERYQNAIGAELWRIARMFPKALIAVYPYDYPQADGRGVLGFGPWIKPAMDDAGISPDMDVRKRILRRVIDALAETQKEVAAECPNMRFVDTRGLLEPADWGNELHPNGPGFDKVAAAFAVFLDEVNHAHP